MWKRQEETPSNPVSPANPVNPMKEGASVPAMSPLSGRTGEIGRETSTLTSAHIGKSVRIKGELRGSEDLFIDGEVEGTIELPSYELTIGSSGKVQANVNAKKVIIIGSIKGNIRATDSVDIRKSGSLIGDLVVAGVVIAEGAYFKGSIDIQKASQPETKPSEPRKMDSPPRSETPGKLAGVAVAGGAK